MSLIPALPDAIYLVDREGCIQFCNAGLEQFSGYSAEELRCRPALVLYPPDVAPALIERQRQVRRGEPAPPVLEVELVRKDGARVPVKLAMTNVPAVGCMVVVQPSIARTHAASLVHALLDVLPDAMVVVDATGHIVGTNAQTEQLFGYRRAELLGRPVEGILPERFRRGHEQYRAAYAATPHTRPMGSGLALYGRRHDGTEFPVEVSLSPLQIEGGLLVIAAIRDATARRQTEAGLQAALQAKDVLLKETLHRVKNNFQVVSSLLDLQADMVADPQVRARLAESQQRIRAMALIHESLYHAGDVAQIDAADFLRRLSTRLFQAYRAPSDRLALRCTADACWLDLSRAIPCGLILHELLSNALKHAFPDGRAGEIHIGLCQEPPGTCVLTVRDDGVGVPASLDVRQTECLGLQLVSLLADQLGATIALERRGGTAFTLTFPLADSG